MLSKKLSFVALATFTMALASGCHLYLDDRDNDRFPGDGEAQPGDSCQSNNDCAPGCYCTDGPGSYCEETGFCDANFPCSDGYVCDDRGTCVPEDNTCAEDADCDAGDVCDTTAGTCGPAPACASDDDCTLGDVCDADTGDCRGALACDEHVSKASCEADANNDCEGVNRGINCTHPTGGDCEVDPEPCTCESFEFVACIDTPSE